MIGNDYNSVPEALENFPDNLYNHRMLKVLLWLVLAVELVEALNPGTTGDWHRRLLYDVPAVIYLSILVIRLRVDNARTISWALVGFFWAWLMLSGLTEGGVKAPCYVANVLVIAYAGLLLSSRVMAVFVAITVLMGALMLHFDPHFTSIWLASDHSPGRDFYSIVAIFICIAAVVHMARESVLLAFKQARQELLERRQTEEALRRSETWLRQVLTATNMGIWEYNVADNKVIWSEQMPVIFGVQQEELTGTLDDIMKRMTIDEQFSVSQRLKASIEGGPNEWSSEQRLTWKDGSIHWMRSTGRVIRNEDGRAIRMAGTATDITEEKAERESLQACADEIRAIFKSVSEGITVTDLEGVIVAVNDSVLHMHGYDKTEELIGRNANVLLSQRDWERAYNDITLAIENGDVPRSEYTLVRKDGSLFSAEFKASILCNASGASTGFLCLTRDISERKLADTALRDSEERFRSIVNRSPMGLHMFELRGDDLVLIDCNDAADRFTGIDTRSRIGMPLESAFPALANTEIPSIYRRVAMENIYWRKNDMNYSDGDVTCVYDVHAFQASLGRMVVLFLDVSERKRAMEERDWLEAQLRHSQKMEAVGQLAGGIAHDFNNLLQVIVGYSELAMEELEEQNLAYPSLEQVRDAANRAGALTRQLLTFGRRDHMLFVNVDIDALIHNILKMLRRVIGEHVEVTFNSQYAPHHVNADPGQIEQVLMNLCINSRDAMPEGGSLTISTTNVGVRDIGDQLPPGAMGEYILIEVADTGLGIPLNIQDRIYEPFFTTKPVGKGTGMGLAIAYAIVERHQGFIRLESVLGKGTQFKIYLPSAPSIPAKSDVVKPTAHVVGGDETILVVEDEATVRDIATKILKQAGYNLILASNGEEAVVEFNSHKDQIALVLLDVILPYRSGWEVRDIIHKTNPTIPIILCTGYAMGASQGDQAMIDSDIVLHKPYAPHQLLQKVGTAFGRN